MVTYVYLIFPYKLILASFAAEEVGLVKAVIRIFVLLSHSCILDKNHSNHNSYNIDT